MASGPRWVSTSDVNWTHWSWLTLSSSFLTQQLSAGNSVSVTAACVAVAVVARCQVHEALWHTVSELCGTKLTWCRVRAHRSSLRSMIDALPPKTASSSYEAALKLK